MTNRSRRLASASARRRYDPRMQHFEEARQLWQSHVPSRGQAATVQGELLRAVEKLRDEAQRNGNVNWGAGHALLGAYLRDVLTSSGLFDGATIERIHRDIDRLLDHDYPENDNATYDRLADRVVEWARAHPQPVPHAHNPELHV
jgi:hypothetical protein